MATIWQQLGAFVYNVDNVDENRLEHFRQVGGRWVVPVLLGDDLYGPINLAALPDFKAKCVRQGLRCGGWFNGWGEPADDLARRFAEVAADYKLGPIILDLEASYKETSPGNAAKMPELLAACRALMPGRSIAVTSFGFLDRAMIWNGRTLSPPRSFYDLKIRFIPQHYTQYDGKYAAAYCMKDLRDNGATDLNIADASAPGGRGVPLSYVHGVLEATGMDAVNGVAADLEEGLYDLRAAKRFGFTYGFSIYTLENVNGEDWNRLAAERGKLFLV